MNQSGRCLKTNVVLKNELGQTIFREIWVKDALRTDIVYCNIPRGQQGHIFIHIIHVVGLVFPEQVSLGTRAVKEWYDVFRLCELLLFFIQTYGSYVNLYVYVSVDYN